MLMRSLSLGVLLSTAAVALVVSALPGAAQQPPTLGGERVLGGPPNPDIGARIRGIAQPPMPASEDKLPVSQLKVPQGFRIETYIHGLPDARSMRLGDKGTLFVSNRNRDKVYAIVDS